MALKAIVKSLDEVPEQFRELYAQEGDTFVLAVDDTDYRSRLNEFRNNNIELANKLKGYEGSDAELQQLREQMARFENVDPDKAKEALDKLQQIEEKQLIDAGKMDEVLAQRTERMRQDYEGRIDALSKDRDTYKGQAETFQGRLTDHIIDNSLQMAVTEVAAARKGAMRDILSRGREVWKLDEQGNPVPHGGDGKVLYGKDGQSPLTMTEWAQGLVQETPYLFEGSAGGGGGGGDHKPGSERTVNSMDQDSINSNIEGIAAGTVTVQTS
jgi:hypothetical protein